MTIALVAFGTTALIDIELRDQLQFPAPLFDPGSFVITVIDPEGTSTTYTYGADEELTRQSLGRYVLSIPVGVEGVWTYAFATTSPGAADNGTFSVGLDPAA